MNDDAVWKMLCQLEPRLLKLADDARTVKAGDDPYFCANDVWFARFGLKDQLVRLVGWRSTSPHTFVRSSRAYDVAYGKLYGMLPNCRWCGCPRLGTEEISVAEWTPAAVRTLVWDLCNGKCAYCGVEMHPIRDFTVDHKVARKLGGDNGIGNLVGCCRNCNSRKGDRPMDEWLRIVNADIEEPAR